MKKPQYKKGAEARKSFESTMSKLFRAPKVVVKPKPSNKKAESEK
jgi:hypothetical protein